MTSFPPEAPDRAVILAAVDGSHVSAYAAAATARFSHIPGSEVHLLHVLDRTDGRAGARAIEYGRLLLEKIAEAAGLADMATLHLATGSAPKAIIQLAADLHADLIVVGAHDLNPIQKLVLGSVSSQVIRRAGCPVYVARRKDHKLAAPEIEPPCPMCLETQHSTHGEVLWCAEHRRRHVSGRLHYQMAEGYGAGSAFLRA